jgi:hypothetical protein
MNYGEINFGSVTTGISLTLQLWRVVASGDKVGCIMSHKGGFSMTFNLPAIGGTSLGIVVGWLVRYFIRRFSTFGPAVLSSVLMMVFGGAVIKFLGEDKNAWWFYPIGLLIGFTIYQIIVMVLLRNKRTRRGGLDEAAFEVGPSETRKGALSDNEPRFGNIDGSGPRDLS